MGKRERKKCMRRGFAFLLSLAVGMSGIGYVPASKITAEAADQRIPITSAEDLKKIGNDASFPMDGDYVLTQDIDLNGENWTPIGGASGADYKITSGSQVFSGTFDGEGHVIDGLKIQYSGSGYGESGLFSIIGSASSADAAEVKNINFTNVSISHTLSAGDGIGTLAGTVNGYARIDNIAVLGGSIEVNGNNGGDLLGAGGVVGQVRTQGSEIAMSDIYNAADVTVTDNVSTEPVRCGGILGRVHGEAASVSLTSCLNTGMVSYKGSAGYAVAGESSLNETANNRVMQNCYYLQGSGSVSGTAVQLTQEQLGETSIASALGDQWSVSSGGQVMLKMSEGKLVAPIPSPVFAEGDSMSSVTKDFTLPLVYTPGTSEESITWNSSDSSIIAINGGTASVSSVLSDTNVTLTAETASGRQKTFTLTVVSNLSLNLNQEYAKAGTAITASVSNAPETESFTYQWTADGNVVSGTASYTPTENDWNKFLTVTATLESSENVQLVKRIYCSKLPVVYIDTEDGNKITSKTEYKDATMHIQGNDKFNSGNTTLYDGGISIRGRGNSTWNMSYTKLPYKIKLDSKTNLLGFGTSKHWTLLANYMDESLIRNTTSYDLSGAMGMNYLKSTHVDVILNGVYAGNYQLVGNVRIEESRVDIYDWEDLAGDVAKAIGKDAGITGDDRDALEDYLNENMEWITSGSVTYNGVTYNKPEYFEKVPKNADGSINVSGGFLYELDEYDDEVSSFVTDHSQLVKFKSPEYVITNQGLYNYASRYVKAVDASIHASDFYVTVKEEENTEAVSSFAEDYAGRQHYTDLVDMESLVNYFILNEFFWNTETMKKSTFMYKDLNQKLFIGPVWDMDWTSNSIVSESETNYPEQWMTTTRSGENGQKEQWYKYLIGDPYFVTKAYECYQKNRQNFEDIVKDGGIIDQAQEYLAESAQANYAAKYLQHWSDFTTETERLRAFLERRLDWMDRQFTSVNTLMASLGKYSASDKISVTVNTENEAETTYTAAVTDKSVSKVGFYINGILKGTADVVNGTASLTANDSNLEREKGKLNVVQVRGMDASGNLISDGSVSNYAAFTKEIPAGALSGTVTVSGTATVGSVLTAKVADSNNSGTLSYQWYADGAEISGAVSSTYRLTEAELGKTIKVMVFSSVETGRLESLATAAVTQPEEIKNDHLIINQVYGGGANDETPVSHSFIEIYNPTEREISLEGYSLGYLSGGKNGYAAAEVKLALDGSKSIPAHTSYLIRCEAQDTSTPDLITLSIEVYDQEWSQTIDNKRYRLILYDGAEIEDGVSVNEDAVEGDALADGTISKRKAIRRKDFADTNDNQADFAVVSYQSANADTVSANRPRSLADGAWDGNTEPEIPPTETKLEGTLSIRGNAVAGAVLYADAATNNTGTLSFQWYADGSPIAGAEGMFYVVDKSLAGKTVSVVIESTVQTGTMSFRMASPVKVTAAQTGHLIINQVYGCGTKDGAVSHSFIELYNPTAGNVSLEGYRICYTSGDAADSFDLAGEIPANTSYLIRCAEGKAGSVVYTIEKADAEWNLAISNKQYSVVLMNGETQIDGVSVNEAAVEGTPLKDPEGDEIISKKKAIRRICFIDTDSNADDFEVLNYSKITEAILETAAPRSSADGVWGKELFNQVKPGESEAEKKELNSAVNQAASYTEASAYTAESWAALQEALAKANGVLNNSSSTKEQIQEALDSLNAALKGLKKAVESGKNPPAGTEVKTLAAPSLTSVKSVIRSGNSNVAVKVSKVEGAAGYRIYRKSGGKVTLLGTTADGTYYDVKPVGGKASYLAEAVNGTAVSAKSAEVSITLPKATAKVTAKAVKTGGRRAVKITWKRVKGASKYMVFRSAKSGSGYKRIAVVKKAKTASYTDKKVAKGKKYYYRVVAVKKKAYSPSKNSKAVKVK